MDDTSVDRVLAIEVRCRSVADEELGAVGVRAGIRHRQDALVGVRQPNLLISKLLTVNALATGSISSCRITALHHEPIDDTMEAVVFVVILGPFLTGAECAEVLCRLGHLPVKDFKDYTARLEPFLSLLTDRDIKEGLDILWAELRQGVKITCRHDSLLIVVDSLTKESC